MPTRTAEWLIRTGCVALICLITAVPRAAFPAPSIRVEVGSFWYESTPPPFPTSESEPAVLTDASARVLTAIGDLLARFPVDFPQPPPHDVVVRAKPREEMQRLVGLYADTSSYGGAKLVGSTVFIDVNRSAFVGWQALNDAELRCFLGHELIHAYQFATGSDPGNGPELWRREIEAYTWEANHLEPAVRSWYREDLAFTLRMYRELLE
jgi:hypothetical protein